MSSGNGESKVKTKTVLLASNLYRPNIGGIENSLYHLSLSYQEMGYEVIIFASDISPSNDIFPTVSEDGGARVYRYTVSKYSGLYRYIKHWINGTKLLVQIRKTHAPILVISRYHLICVMLKLADYKNYIYLVPGVVKNQNSGENLTISGSFAWRFAKSLEYKFNDFLQRRALSKATRIGVFSNHMRHQIEEVDRRFEAKIFECKPGVDVERFFPLATTDKFPLPTANKRDALIQAPSDSKPFVVLCVGRFVKAKGFEYVIRSLQYIDGAELWLLGDGPDSGKYKELIAQLSLGGKVKLLNATPRPEEIYRLADCFVMSSVYEPFGQTIIEALASGLPIIAFDSNIEGVTTATSEFLTDENVMWVKSVEASAIAEKITTLQKLSNEQISKICQKNRDKAIECFTWNSLANALEDQNKLE